MPGLILATAMPLPFAIGTSLVLVGALGLTTATCYALSGLVDWRVTALLVVGGAAGTIGGLGLGRAFGARKGLLERGFAAVVIAIGAYIIASSMWFAPSPVNDDGRSNNRSPKPRLSRAGGKRCRISSKGSFIA